MGMGVVAGARIALEKGMRGRVWQGAGGLAR